MIVRIVKLHIEKKSIQVFKDLFYSRKDMIQQFHGCLNVELLQDVAHPDIFITHSLWQSEADLNAYRKSDFFQSTWASAKQLFSSRPEAWSLTNPFIHEKDV